MKLLLDQDVYAVTARFLNDLRILPSTQHAVHAALADFSSQ